MCYVVVYLYLFCVQKCAIIWPFGTAKKQTLTTNFQSTESSNPGQVVVFHFFSQYDKRAVTPFVDGYLGVFFTQILSRFNVHESLKLSTKFFNGLPNWKVLGEVLELNYLLTFSNDHTAAELLILIFHSHYHLQSVGKSFMSQRICTNHATRAAGLTSYIDCVLSAPQLQPELVISAPELQTSQILIVYYLHQLRLINSPSEG